MIIVQQIETVWGKESRSSEKATVRNSVPESFDFPFSSKQESIHHLLQFKEESNFQTPQTAITSFDDKELNNFFGALRLYYEGDALKVKYCYSSAQVGAPSRTIYPKEVLLLKTGEWGRVIYTGRFSGSDTSYGSWYYRKEVFNIANLEKSNKSIFRKTQPKKTFDDTANLR